MAHRATSGWLQALALTLAASAATAAPTLSWQCALEADGRHHVYCRPLPVEQDVMRVAALMERPAEPARTLQPGPDMRPVAERGESEVYSAEAWRVPLHSQPSDPARVVELLRSVLCGREPACEVRYEPRPLRLTRR